MNTSRIDKLNEDAKRTERILDLIMEARRVASINKEFIGLAEKSMMDYKDDAAQILGVKPGTQAIKIPSDASVVIDKIRKVNKVSTLKKYATAMKFITKAMLYFRYRLASDLLRNHELSGAEEVVMHPSFRALITLAGLSTADYRINETPKQKRTSKKSSLIKTDKNWREKLAKALPEGDNRGPGLALILTGARPSEIEKGLEFVQVGQRLRVMIRGAKVTHQAGQTWRSFDVAEGTIKELLLDLMDPDRTGISFTVKVNNGNSLTTCIRSVCRRVFEGHNHDITCYTLRHAMASDCKYAIASGADPDLVSQVLGHAVDKTATYYGSHSHGGGDFSLAPANVKVSRAVKNKLKQRLANRKLPSKSLRARSKRMH